MQGYAILAKCLSRIILDDSEFKDKVIQKVADIERNAVDGLDLDSTLLGAYFVFLGVTIMRRLALLDNMPRTKGDGA